MLEFTPPPGPRDLGWINLRERLAQAARETHFFAFSADASNSAAILVISERLAELAMSIPREPSHIGSIGLVDASALFATQVLQLGHRAHDNSNTMAIE